MRYSSKNRWIVIGAAVGLAAGVASAGTVTALTIDATSSLGAGTFEVTTDQGTTLPDGSFIWSLLGPVDITDGGMTIATVVEGSVLMSTTGGISHSFVVRAGGVNTSFSLGVLPFAVGPFANPWGRTSAGMTLTDTNGNGASLTGLGAGGTIFEAGYNSGSVFANLLTGPFAAGSFDSFATSDESPGGAGNFAPFGGPVTDMSLNWDFRLSANDSSGGTSVWVVIPAPAAGLGFIGGLGLLGARRRR